jgi:uncharacterized membrane protein
VSVKILRGAGSALRPALSDRSERYGPSQALPGSARLQGIDAARGIAMILVCVSHVRGYLAESAPQLEFVLTSISRLATPTFLLLSGFVAAYVLASGRPQVRITLFDRGLFVLLIGHFLLNLEDLRHIGATEWIVGRVTITDAIGICLMSAVVLYRARAAVLGTLGVSLALVSWPVAMTLEVESTLGRHIATALFNLDSEASAFIDAAIVPYLGVFLIGMALSKRSSEELGNGRLDRIARRLAIYGFVAVGLVLLGVLSWFAFKSAGLTPTDPATERFVRLALDPRSKLPPSPGYLLFYGGGGLMITTLCLLQRPRLLMSPIVNWASTIGRASLMCFVVQDWLLRVLPVILRFENVTSIAFWTVYFCCAVLAIHWLATRWDSMRGNRFLTLGLRSLARTSSSQPSPAKLAGK